MLRTRWYLSSYPYANLCPKVENYALNQIIFRSGGLQVT